MPSATLEKTGAPLPRPAGWTVLSFYRFARNADPASWRAPLQSALAACNATGTVLLAGEGVNGTLAVPAGRLGAENQAKAALRALPGCSELAFRRTATAARPFKRLKVRLKREIVTLGEPLADPSRRVGRYVAPEAWNAVLDDPGTLTVDTRNSYETRIGTFRGATDPATSAFTDFPAWFRARQAEWAAKGGAPDRIAMFCTGGIRCEKATSFLLAEGVADVIHLQGGILNYLDRIPPGESRWQGECFVFDDRVSLVHGLGPGTHAICYACKEPVSEADRASPTWEEGVSCPHCIGRRTDADRARFRERQKQMRLEKQRLSRAQTA